jgi:hypothetical protein
MAKLNVLLLIFVLLQPVFMENVNVTDDEELLAQMLGPMQYDDATIIRMVVTI